MVRVAHPRKGTQDTDGDGEIGDNAHNKDSIVVVLVVDED